VLRKCGERGTLEKERRVGWKFERKTVWGAILERQNDVGRREI